MSHPTSKTRLDLSISEDVLEKAKRIAKEKGIPLSRLIENFLKFFNDPWVYCFKCGEKFDSFNSKLCPKCGWMICPKCSTCGCGLDEKTVAASFHMRRVYEDLLAGRVK